MSIKERIKKIANKNDFLSYLYLKISKYKYRLLKNTSDEKFLSRKYKKIFGKKINLDEPVLYSEKLQWLKLHDRNPLYSTLVDKYLVREYVKKTIGEKYLNELYGVYDTFKEIDFNSLPNSFVIKCTHDSGTSILCKDKASFNCKKAKRIINLSLKTNYYFVGREWPYKNVKPRIVIEKFLRESGQNSLLDYKFYCFGGKPTYLLIISDRGIDTRADYFDMDFNRLDFAQGYPRSNKEWQKPSGFEKMKELASILSNGIPHVRVDFYCVDGNIIFGEMTFFDSGGFAKFEPDIWDKTFGDHIDLDMAYEIRKR